MNIFTVIGIITVATLAGTTASILFIWLKEKFSKGATNNESMDTH